MPIANVIMLMTLCSAWYIGSDQMVVAVVFVPLARLTTRMKEFDADLSVRGRITISSCTLYIVMCSYINFVLIHTYRCVWG